MLLFHSRIAEMISPFLDWIRLRIERVHFLTCCDLSFN